MKGISRRFISIIWVTSLMVAMCLLYSCAKMTVIESDGTGTVDLYVTVEDAVSLSSEENLTHSRAIAPSQPTVNELNQDYTYELSGSSKRSSLAARPVTVTNGRASIVGIPQGSWDLELVASKNGQEVLRGSSSVTVDGGETAVAPFTLTPVEGGTGNVNVTFTLNTDDLSLLRGSNATVQIGLYDPLDYSLKAGSEQRPNLANTFTYNPTGIDAGEYIVRVTFTAGANSTNLTANSTATWADTLYIERTRTTEAHISLPRLLQKPVNPTAVSFTNETPTLTAGHVTANLTWQGSYNANSYVIEVLEYTGTNHPTTEQGWTALVNAAQDNVETYNAVPDGDDNYLKHTNPFASQYYMEGGLLPGQTTLKLALEIGTKYYAARMKAVNSWGSSEWRYFGTLNPQIHILQRPTEPANFRFTAGIYDSATQSFIVTLRWDDATNEDGYELELKKFGDGITPRNDADWIARGGTSKTYKGHNLTSASGDPCKYDGGGLQADSTFAQISIKRNPGKEHYAVRIRSYNDQGESLWVYPPAGTGGSPGALLMPQSYISNAVTTQKFYDNNSKSDRYNADITIHDIPGSTCEYEFEFIYMNSGQLIDIFTQPTPEAKNAEWVRLYNLPANNIATGRSGKAFRNTLDAHIPLLNAGTPFPFRVRTVIRSNGNVIDATRWNYYEKTLIESP